MPIFLALIFCLVMAGCGESVKDSELDARSFTIKDLVMVQQDTGITIPAGSRGLSMYYCRSQTDPSFIAKIEIPTASSASVATAMEQIPVTDITSTNPLSKKVTWWNPSKATTRIERKFKQMSSVAFVDALLCEEDGHWVLYVFWSAV